MSRLGAWRQWLIFCCVKSTNSRFVGVRTSSLEAETKEERQSNICSAILKYHKVGLKISVWPQFIVSSTKSNFETRPEIQVKYSTRFVLQMNNSSMNFKLNLRICLRIYSSPNFVFPDFHWMETSNPFLHLWYRWTPLTASPLRVNVEYRRYTGYRSILDPAAGILTGQPTNEVTILRPPAQAQRRITPNTPMGIRRSTIINSVNLSNQSGKELIYLKKYHMQEGCEQSMKNISHHV